MEMKKSVNDGWIEEELKKIKKKGESNIVAF